MIRIKEGDTFKIRKDSDKSDWELDLKNYEETTIVFKRKEGEMLIFEHFSDGNDIGRWDMREDFFKEHFKPIKISFKKLVEDYYEKPKSGR